METKVRPLGFLLIVKSLLNEEPRKTIPDPCFPGIRWTAEGVDDERFCIMAESVSGLSPFKGKFRVKSETKEIIGEFEVDEAFYVESGLHYIIQWTAAPTYAMVF